MTNDLARKLLAMASKNGISGMGGDPSFVLAAGITGLDKKLTGTASQKTMLTYELTLYVGNAVTGTVFGSTTVKFTGVGDNERRAANNAVSELKDNNAIQQMLVNSTNKIVEYYNTHAGEIKAQADILVETDDAEVQKIFLKILNDFNLVFGNYKIVDNSSDEHNSNKYYSNDVTKYNNFCLVTINQCLLNDKPDLARKIAKFIREDLPMDNEDIYHLSTETKDKAAQAIAEYEAEQN